MAQITDAQIIQAFSLSHQRSHADSIVDFLGIRTRTAYISHLSQLAGTVEGYPAPANFHASQLEWAGTLRAALQSEAEFAAIELGAGWCPWLVASAVAAERCGATAFRLTGVEACSEHLTYAAQHVNDNLMCQPALAAAQVQLLLGIAGVEDGTAEFPEIDDPAGNWGAAAVIAGQPSPAMSLTRYSGVRKWFRRWRTTVQSWRGRLSGQSGLARLPSYSLTTLLAPFAQVDLLHVDIQGHEYEVLDAGIESVCRQVKRAVIGTHSPSLADQVRQLLSARDWVLEAEEACQMQRSRGKESLLIDGCQVWRNPSLQAKLTANQLIRADRRSQLRNAV